MTRASSRLSANVVAGFGLAAASLTLGLFSSACRSVFSSHDCWRGLAEGSVVEVELLEPHTPDGPYRYWSQSLPDDIPTCEGVDGLGPGIRLRFRLVHRAAPARDCMTYAGELLDSLPGVVAVPQGSGGASVFSTQYRYTGSECPDTYWRFFAMRHIDLDDDPFGEVPTPGEYPPVVLRREINACGCLDRWVGVIRHVDPEDAGVDDG